MFESRRISLVDRLATMPAGAELAAALDALDPTSLADGEHVDVLVALARQAAHAHARLLQGMTAVAARSVGQGFDSDDVAFALHLTRRGAQNQVALAQDLLTRLPMVWGALDRGELCPARARVFSDVLIAAPDDVARAVASLVLPAATEMTAGQLRARLQKELLTADPDSAKARYERSVSERRVDLTANDDTTACLSGIFLPPAKAAAAFERVDAIARGLKRDGDARTLDQLRADVFCDLLAGVDCGASPIARPGVVELLVPLETLTGQSDAPAHLAGFGPVIADIARQVAAQQAEQQAARRQAEAAASERGRALGEWLASRWRYRVYDRDGHLLYAGTTRARPGTADATDTTGRASTTDRTAERQAPLFSPEHARAHQPGANPTRPPYAAASERSGPDGALSNRHDPNGATPSRPDDATSAQCDPGDVAPSRRATDLPASGGGVDGPPTKPRRSHPPATRRVAACRGEPVAPGVLRLRPLDPYPPTPGDPEARFPDAATRRWIAARDTTCRAPGCTNPARTCDTDHTMDHAQGGPTTDENLGLLCRHHHRLKHEGGFWLHQPRPGTFVWESPDGQFYRVDPDPPP